MCNCREGYVFKSISSQFNIAVGCNLSFARLLNASYLKCHTKGENWGIGSPCKTKGLNFSLLLDIIPTKKLSLPVPTRITDHILEKQVSLITFRPILPKILAAAYIFSNTITTNLKKLIGNKSLNAKQCPAGLSLRIIPLNLYGKPWRWGKRPAKNQKFTHYP